MHLVSSSSLLFHREIEVVCIVPKKKKILTKHPIAQHYRDSAAIGDGKSKPKQAIMVREKKMMFVLH
jgi:hypothetical protein